MLGVGDRDRLAAAGAVTARTLLVAPPVASSVEAVGVSAGASVAPVVGCSSAHPAAARAHSSSTTAARRPRPTMPVSVRGQG